MTPFAAVLLAGGQSQRMGRDKALLPLADGRLLWQRQLAVLQALEPAELFISGPAREGFPPDVPLLADEFPGRGPLGGLAAALGAMESPRLVVLAIDLPRMTAEFLRGMLAREAGGVVPRHDGARGGFYEPLAAIYPRECLPQARARLAGTDHSLQAFVREAVAASRIKEWPLREAGDLAQFTNWNAPASAV